MEDLIYLIASFAVILAGALLFTNAIEWIGHKLGLGEGAVGSLLAAVGTALPETLIAVVALIGVSKSEDVAVGAIVGAPFLLATLAMGLVGGTAYFYRGRRKQGIRLEAHVPTLDRDLAFFMVFFGLALGLGFGAPEAVRYPAAGVFVAAYLVYVAFTLRGGGEAQAEESLNPLIMARGPAAPAGGSEEPPLSAAVLQVLIGLGAMVGGAHLFVESLLHFATEIGVEPIVLSLILAPLATELPEKVNSFFWVREGKDSLALGNITGAMVFQSTIPVAIGLLFTSWELPGNAAISMVLGLAGGLIAFWALRLRDRFELPAVLAWLGLYAAFIVIVAL
ncbi:MAG: sodium:calcium antiporter [Solirubrobacterales bacterium]|nr:sodium:calcium antiporter [Solirubrobacterales bacterium]